MVEKYFGELKNPFFLLANIYFVVIIILAITNLLLGVSFKELLMGFNLPVLMVAIGSVMYNVFLIFSYRNGAKISTMFNIITPSISISFVIIGLVFFKENFSLLNGLGIIFCTRWNLLFNL